MKNSFLLIIIFFLLISCVNRQEKEIKNTQNINILDRDALLEMEHFVLTLTKKSICCFAGNF